MKKRRGIGKIIASVIVAIGLVMLVSTQIYGVTMQFLLHSSANYDIKGDGIQTTYNNNGYTTVLKIGSSTANIVNGTGSLNGVTCTTTGTLVSDGAYVKVNYRLVNSNSTPVTISLASHADTQVGTNDSAAIETLTNNRGVSMTDGTNTFQLLLAKSYGVTDVDTFWYGRYSDRQSNMWNQGSTSPLTNTDSGLAFSWQNREIPANGELNLSVLFGVGKLNEPPTITLTNTLNSSYKANESIHIEGNVNDIDSGDSLTIKYALDGGTEYTVPGTYVPNGTAKPYSTDISLPAGVTQGTHKLQVWVRDSTGNMSEVIEKTFTVNVAAKVTAYYYYKDSTEVLAPSVEVNGYVSDTYTTSAKTINGYELIATPANATGTITSASMSVYYYYKQKVTLTTNYIDENTGNAIVTADTETKYDGDTYSTSAKTLTGYQLVTNPTNASGNVGRSDISVTYGYKKVSEGVEIKYIDQSTGEEIATKVTKTGLEGDAYTSTAATVTGYELVKTPTNANGNMTVAKTTVTYEYRLVSKVTASYINANTNAKIVTDVQQSKKEGDTYTTEKKTFSGYTLVDNTDNTSGTMGRENIEVKYYYRKNSGPVVTKHIDVVTREEIDNRVTLTGLEGLEYTTSAATIAGYKLEVTPANATGTYTTGSIEVVYEYRKQSKVTAKYIDENTGAEITGTKVETIHGEGDAYTTEQKIIAGYTYTKKDGAASSGTVGRTDLVVNYYYRKNSAPVVTKHIDVVTREEIKEGSSQTGLEGLNYTTSAETINGYVLEVTPANATGQYSTSEIVVTYEYRKQSKVTAKYINEHTGAEIAGTKVETTYGEGAAYNTEKKTITGYTFTKQEGDESSGTVGRTDLEVRYYYRKNSGPVVTKHIDVTTREEIDNRVTQTGLEGLEYTTTANTIAGYKLEVTPANATGNYTTGSIEVVYEYRKQSKVTAKYIDEFTRVEIAGTKVETTYGEDDNYTTEQKTITGYTYTKQDGAAASGIVGRGDLVVNYYYRKNSAPVVTKYIDVVTKEEIHAESSQTGLEGLDYTTSPINITDYVLEVTPANANGQFAMSQIDVVYEYRKQSNVVVKFYDVINNEYIATEVTKKYKEAENYTTTYKEVDGYQLVETPANATGTMGRQDIEVVYGYKKISGGVVVSYIDQATGNPVYPTQYITGLEKDSYTTVPEDVEGYELVVTPDNKDGELTVEPITVTYEYRLKVYLTVKYIDEVTKEELKPTVTTKFLQGDTYTTTKESFTRYEFTNRFGTANGTFSRSDITVIYYYKYNSNVTTRYINQLTNEEISTPLVVKYKEQDVYNTTPKNISGYTLVASPENKTGIVERDHITVTYEYRRESEGVEVRYIDQATGNKISNSIIKTGVEGTPYDSSAKVVAGYELVKTPDNAYGQMTVGKTIVTYEYRFISYVTVNYEDEITRRQLKPSVVTKYLQGENYTSTQEDFEGYSFTRVDGEPNGTVARENIVITYFYKKNSKVIVQYVDMLDSDNPIAEETIVNGVQGEDYDTDPLNIPGYEYIRSVGRTNGKMSDTPITVTYKYKKLSSVITEHIDIDTGDKIATDVVRKYVQGQAYETSSKSIPGYIVVESPEEKDGVMGREDVVKTYKYKHLSQGLVVKYVDMITEEVLAEELYEGNVGDVVELQPKSFMYYMLKTGPDYDTVELTANEQEIVFYYLRSVKIDVVGVEDETGRELFRTTIEGPEGYPYNETDKRDLAGYELIEMPENAVGTFDRNDTEIIFTYVKLDESIKSQVDVVYIDRDTNEILATDTIVGGLGTSYRATRRNFFGYELVRIEGDEYGQIIEEQQTVTFVYVKKAGAIIVSYEDENGNIVECELYDGRAGEDYSIELLDVRGFERISYEGELSGKFIDGVIEIKVYLRRLTSQVHYSKVIVNYVDQFGNTIQTDEYQGEVGESYNVEVLDIEGYDIIKLPKELHGVFEEEDIVLTIEIEQIVLPQERGTVLVRYIDEKGNTIKSKTIEGNVGEDYTVTVEEIDGYELVQTPANMQGQFVKGTTTVVIKMKKYVPPAKTGTVTVKYVDENNNVLKSDTMTGNEGDTYTVTIENIPGYEFVQAPANLEGRYIDGNTDITIRMRKIVNVGTVTVKYVDQEGRILKTATLSGNEGTSYRVTVEDIAGYELVDTTSNLEGTYTDGNIDVTIRMRKIIKVGTVTVKYVDQEGRVLKTTTLSGNEGTSYRVTVENITDYELVDTTSNLEGTYTAGNINVTIRMRKILKVGTVTIKYVDEDGTLVKTETMTGYEGETYQVIPNSGEGYDISDYPTNLTGQYTDGNIDVVIIIHKIIVAPAEKGTIIVKFVDSKGNVILEKIVKTGEIGEEFVYEAPAIDGYKPVHNAVIKATYKDGELVFDVIYEKDETVVGPDVTQEEPVTPEKTEDTSTGDMNVIALVLTFVTSLVVLSKKVLRANKEN